MAGVTIRAQGWGHRQNIPQGWGHRQNTVSHGTDTKLGSQSGHNTRLGSKNRIQHQAGITIRTEHKAGVTDITHHNAGITGITQVWGHRNYTRFGSHTEHNTRLGHRQKTVSHMALYSPTPCLKGGTFQQWVL